jgi:DNA-binding GntR family transcriptional regulator
MKHASAFSRRLFRPHAETARANLPDRVYKKLKRQILTCSVAPERRLIESTLCAAFRVSRTPLREALNRLALEGLVVAAPVSGYAVAPLTIEDIRHLNEVRQAVEAEAAALAAERASTEDLQAMQANAKLTYKQGHRATYLLSLERNRAFHLAVAHASHNPRLEALVTSILDQVQRAIYFGLDAAIDAKLATEEHLQVMEAIRNHAPRRARELMVEQIKNGERGMLQACTETNL